MMTIPSQDVTELDPEELTVYTPDVEDSKRDVNVNSLVAEPDSDPSHLSIMSPVNTDSKHVPSVDCVKKSEVL